MEETEVSYNERLHASAVHFLISENEKEAALTLLSCTVDLEWAGNNGYNLFLRGPRHIYETMKDEQNLIRKSIIGAFNAY